MCLKSIRYYQSVAELGSLLFDLVSIGEELPTQTWPLIGSGVLSAEDLFQFSAFAGNELVESR